MFIYLPCQLEIDNVKIGHESKNKQEADSFKISAKYALLQKI